MSTSSKDHKVQAVRRLRAYVGMNRLPLRLACSARSTQFQEHLKSVLEKTGT